MPPDPPSPRGLSQQCQQGCRPWLQRGEGGGSSRKSSSRRNDMSIRAGEWLLRDQVSTISHDVPIIPSCAPCRRTQSLYHLHPLHTDSVRCQRLPRPHAAVLHHRRSLGFCPSPSHVVSHPRQVLSTGLPCTTRSISYAYGMSPPPPQPLNSLVIRAVLAPLLPHLLC